MPVINSFIHSIGSGGIISGSASTTITFNTSGTRLLIPGPASMDQSDTDGRANNTTLSYNFTNLTSNTQYSKRLIVVAFGAYFNTTSGTITNVTIGGITATKAIGSTNTSDQGASEIWYALVPTGNDADTVITSSVTMLGCNATMHRIMGVDNAIPSDTDSQKATGATNRSVTLSHPTNGISIVCSTMWGVASNPTCTWTNATENNDSLVVSNTARFSSAYYTSASSSSRTFTPTFTLSGTIETVGACWA